MFVGRKSELKALSALAARLDSHLIVVKGRRRIGKSMLVEHFGRTLSGRRYLSFTGLAPQKGLAAQIQRDYFAQKLSEHCALTSDELAQLAVARMSWGSLLSYFTRILMPGDVILFDEISWMGSQDPAFLSVLKAWWDELVLRGERHLLFLCGSITPWIEENILKSTNFYGRISLTLTLQPLSIRESSELLVKNGWKGSPFETYALLAITGGVPWYLNRIQCSETAEENIRRLCFDRDAFLLNEFTTLFNDLFNGRGSGYKKVLQLLEEGPRTLREISAEFSQAEKSAQLVEHLVTCGFIEEHIQWSPKTESVRRDALYRISDPYIRFYLTQMEPRIVQIRAGDFVKFDFATFPGFDGMLGLQVEMLLLQNRAVLRDSIGIEPHATLFDGPYRQTKTARLAGCQIDYLLQTRMKNLFIAEFKFKRRELGVDVVAEVNEKIKKLSIPRSCAAVPVLFHIGGVSRGVVSHNVFYRIIDIAQFLYSEKQ